MPAPREQRLSKEELKAKYGENWGISGADPIEWGVPREPHPKSTKAMTAEQVIRHYKSHGLGFQRKDLP